MYISGVLFKKSCIFLGGSLVLDELGLVTTNYFKDSVSESLAHKVPSSVWHEHVTNLLKKKRKKKTKEKKCISFIQQRRVARRSGLALHSSFAPVGNGGTRTSIYGDLFYIYINIYIYNYINKFINWSQMCICRTTWHTHKLENKSIEVIIQGIASNQ